MKKLSKHKLLDNCIVLVSCLCVIITTNSNKIYAQNPVIENILEELAGDSEMSDVDYSNFVENLTFYMQNPLNLNDATTEQLENLHFLSLQQINNLQKYIKKTGGMQTIYELQLIDGFTPIIIKKMLPFVTVRPAGKMEKIDFKNVLKYGRHQIIGESGWVLQNEKAYNDVKIDSTTGKIPSRFAGNKVMCYFKYKFHYKNRVFAGISAEKDAGEQFVFNDKIHGFDFYSVHFQANKIHKLEQINIGDYHAHFGQGLIMWTGFGGGKSSEVMNIRKPSKTLRYYASNNENNFLRGIGSVVKMGKFEFTSFISYKKIDATVENSDDLDGYIGKFKSFRTSGFHRTKTELKNRKIINELISGGRLSIGFDNLKVAANVVAYKYSKALQSSSKPYQLFDLKDNKNINASIDYLYYFKNLNFFGEIATDKDAHIAVVNGFSTSLISQLSFSMLHRYYQKNYKANYASAFGENSKVKNEQGVYYGLMFSPLAKLQLSAYVDIFKFTWLKYRVDAPSSGYEYLLNINYLVSNNLSINLKLKTERKSININKDDKALKLVDDKTNTHYRLHLSYTVADFLVLSSRVEIAEFTKLGKKQYGYLLYQNAKISVKNIPLTVYLRYVTFDSDYDTRIYTYENDLPYSFAVPAFADKGNSFYILCKYKFNSHVTLSAKYKQVFFPNANSVGTSLQKISGNLKSYIRFQISVRL